MNAKELELKLSDALQREDVLKEKLAESQREFRAADATIENLEAKCAALAAENAGLKAAKEIIRHLNVNREEANFCGIDDCYIDDAVAAMVIPATDAFLDEVRAQGVEMFARTLRGEAEITKACTFKPVQQFEDFACRADEFAAQLRKGVQS